MAHSMTMADYDCTLCGACCVSEWPCLGHVMLDDTEIERLGRMGLPLVGATHPLPPYRYSMLATRIIEDDKRICVAFGGTVGQKCGCTIYEQRPELCRKYQVGGQECRKARARAGLPV